MELYVLAGSSAFVAYVLSRPFAVETRGKVAVGSTLLEGAFIGSVVGAAPLWLEAGLSTDALRGTLTEKVLVHERILWEELHPALYWLGTMGSAGALGFLAGTRSWLFKSANGVVRRFCRSLAGVPDGKTIADHGVLRVLSMFALGAAAVLLLQALVFALVGERLLAVAIALLFVLSALGLHAAAPQRGAPLVRAPDGATAEWFDENAKRFLATLTERWRLLTWTFGGFAAIALAFLGVNAHELNSEIRDGRVAKLKEEIEGVQTSMKSVLGLTSNFAQMLGRITAISDSYQAAISSNSRQGRSDLKLDAFRLSERVVDLRFLQTGIMLRELDVMRRRAAGTINDDEALRVASETDVFTRDLIFRENLFSYCDGTKGYDSQFAEPLLFAADEINYEGSAQDTAASRVRCITQLLLGAVQAINRREESQWLLNTLEPEKARDYQKYLAGKLLSSAAKVSFKVAKVCVAPYSGDCAKTIDALRKIVGDGARHFASLGGRGERFSLEPAELNPAAILRLADALAEASSDEYRSIRGYEKGMSVLLARNEYVMGRVKSESAAMLMLAAESDHGFKRTDCENWTEECAAGVASTTAETCPTKPPQECVEFGKLLDETEARYLKAIGSAEKGGASAYPDAMNSLGYLYAKQPYFRSRSLDAVKYAHLAVEGIPASEVSSLFAIATYATALETIGADFHAARWRFRAVYTAREQECQTSEQEGERRKILASLVDDLCGFYRERPNKAREDEKRERTYDEILALSAESAFRSGASLLWSADTAEICDSVKEERRNNRCLLLDGPGARPSGDSTSAGPWNPTLVAAYVHLSVASSLRPDGDPRALSLLDTAHAELRRKGLDELAWAEEEAGRLQTYFVKTAPTSDTLWRLHTAYGGEMLRGAPQQKATYGNVINNAAWRMLLPCKAGDAEDVIDFAIDAAVSSGWDDAAILDTLAWAWACSGVPQWTENALRAYPAIACLDETFPTGYAAPTPLKEKWSTLSDPEPLERIREFRGCAGGAESHSASR